MNEDSATIEMADSVDSQRLAAYQAARHFAYREALMLDPEAVAEYEKAVEARRVRPNG